MAEISIWNRYKQKLEPEKVYGGQFIELAYGKPATLEVVDKVFAPNIFSKVYGWVQSSPLSRLKIDKFVKDFQIPMEEYESGPFHSFNDFFIRKFKKGKRIFNHHDEFMPAFSEGRYFGFESINESTKFSVKGIALNTQQLLEKNDLASQFDGGPLLISRLCPVDYHRFHYPDDGQTLDFYKIHGKLHSVNPAALAAKTDIFFTNERHVSVLETKNFGKLAYIEVGALCVGRIVQTSTVNTAFKRGDEKGYFLFGGSTVILLGQKGAWTPAPDILEKSRLGIETFIKLGDFVAKRVGPTL